MVPKCPDSSVPEVSQDTSRPYPNCLGTELSCPEVSVMPLNHNVIISIPYCAWPKQHFWSKAVINCIVGVKPNVNRNILCPEIVYRRDALMDNDDIVYCILLVVSLFTGQLVKVTSGCVARQRLVSGVGVVIVVVVCRQDCLHSLFSAVVNALILLLVSARLVINYDLKLFCLLKPWLATT